MGDFQERLDAGVAAREAAGAVAMLLSSQGQGPILSAGERVIGSGERMQPDTVFWIASMTKAVTSVAALALVDAGKLQLDAPLDTILPEFSGLEVLEGFTPDGAPKLRPARSPVTLRRLLSHTSGFGYPWLSERLGRWQAHSGAGALAPDSRAAHIQPLEFEPGEGWSYGIGIDWAGLAIEAVTGKRLDAALDELVLAPLGMTQTTFFPDAALEARRAGVHHRLPDGGLMAAPFDMPREPEVISGGGGLFSTASDYARFLRMLLRGGELDGVRILSEALAAELGRVQTGPHRAGAFAAAPSGLAREFDLYPDMHTGFGLVGMITPQACASGRGAGAISWAGLFNTYFWIDPEADLGGLLLTQTAPFADEGALSLYRAFEAHAYAAQARGGTAG